MSDSKLTQAQIDTFGNFRTLVEDQLVNNTTAKGKPNRIVTTKSGLTFMLDLLVHVARPSKLNKVLNTVKAFEKRGVTKANIQKSREVNGKRVLLHRDTPNGPQPIYMFRPRCCRMYTPEAYRAMRAEDTGLTTPEPIYAMAWEHLPSDMQEKVAAKFPRKVEGYPEFVAHRIGVVVKKGRKTTGKRNQWARLQFLVIGKYGENTVIIPDAIVWDGEADESGKPVIVRLAEVIGADPEQTPYWPETVKQEAPEELELAANAKVAPTTAFDDSFDF